MTSELGLDKQVGCVGEGRDVAVWGREEHGWRCGGNMLGHTWGSDEYEDAAQA